MATRAKTRHRRTRPSTIFVQVVNTLLRCHIVDRLPEQVEVCTDLHLRPYYDDEDETDGLYHSEAKRGTTAFHAYADATRTREEHQALFAGGVRLEDGDTVSRVLAGFLGVLDGLDLGVKAVYLDRGSYDNKCLTLLQAYNIASFVPIVRWGEKIQQELSDG